MPRAVLEEFAVRQSYAQFWWVVSRIDEQPRVRWPGVLSQVSAEPELGRQLALAAERASRGVHRYGELVPHVTSVRLRDPAASTGPPGPLPAPAPASPPAEGAAVAVLVDCPDGSRFGEADNATGRVLSAGPSRVRVVATLVRERLYGDWRVAEIRFVAEGCDARLRVERSGRLGRTRPGRVVGR